VVGPLAQIAHDLNGLLTVVLGYSHMLEAELVGQGRGDIAEIRRAAERAAALTRQLVALRRHDARATPAPPADSAPTVLPPVRVLIVDPDDQVRAVARRILAAAGAIGFDAATVDDAERVFAAADPPIQILLADLPPDDGRGEALIRSLVARAPALRVLHMAVEPGDAPAAAERPGTVIAKPFTPAELVAAVAAALAAGDPLPVAPPVVPTKPRVLVVDDEDSIRGSERRLLERAGFDVTEAGDGAAAVRALGRDRFDVVLSDLQMPELDGLALLREVRKVDLDLPIILITGKPDVASAAQAIEYGAFRYLSKPADNAAVEGVVRLAARSYALARIRREAVAAAGVAATVAADLAGLEVRFRTALDRLWIAYQPIIDARTGAVFGIEALMRSDEPSLPGPEHVLDAARRLSRLPELGRRIRALVGGRAATTAHTIFVNLHPDDLGDPDLVDPAAALSAHAGRVVLEVTERASLHGSPALGIQLDKLRGLGFRIAVDDIGAGYSGLSSFADLMPEIVKIDMSLVRDVHTSPIKRRTIRSLCDLCRDTGVLVVAEGVESPAERDCLIDLGCDLLQGYLIARPDREITG
jgi:EAL domain-containing protein (putative c-di-GMP-specific phosphodiesterase class I)/DNA-binding NarL/FixJ family response regulator